MSEDRKNKFYGAFDKDGNMISAQHIYTEDKNVDENYIKENFQRSINSNINFTIKEISCLEYRNFDKQYDNEYKFVEYMVSENTRKDKNTNITHDLLKEAGFIDKTTPLDKAMGEEYYNITDYHIWELWTIDNYKLNIFNGFTNNSAKWNLHIDNDHCCTVGSVDIDNVWQFNTMMEVLGIKFKL